MRSPAFHIRVMTTIILSLGMTTGFCQESLAQQPGSGPAVAERPKEDAPVLPWDRLIYLPYKNLDEALKNQNSTVVVPLKEYLKLQEEVRAAQAQRTTKSPVSAVITSAIYNADIEKSIARIKADFTVQVLTDGWAQVPLNFGAAAVGKMTVADESEALLRGTGNSAYLLMLNGKKEHSISIELMAKVSSSPDGKSFRVQVPPVGVTTLEVAVPEAEQTLNIMPEVVGLPVKQANDETRVKANLGATEFFQVQWHPKASLKPEMDLLASVTNHTLVSIDRGLIQTHTYLQYDVLRGQLQELKVAVPLGHSILDVSTPEAKVRGWTTKKDEDQKLQIITAELLSDADRKITLEVHTERTLPEGEFPVAGLNDENVPFGIHALDVVRESGQLVVTASKELSLSIKNQQGLVRVDQDEIETKLRRSNSLNYKFYSPKFTLTLDAEPVKPQVMATQSTRLTFNDDELQLLGELNFQVERAGVFEFKLNVPDGLKIDQVRGSAVKDFTMLKDTNELRILLTEKQQGSIGIVIEGHQPLDKNAGEDPLALPILKPQNIERETGSLTIFAPESLEVITQEDSLDGLHPQRMQRQQVGNAVLVSAWQYQRRPISISVITRRKPTRLSANIGTQVNLEQEQVQVTTLLEYNIEHAGIETFRFTVPEAIADRLTVRNDPEEAKPGIKQYTPDDEAVDGWKTITVVLQDRVMGKHRFKLTYDLITKKADEEQEDEAEKAAENFQIQAVRVLGLEAEHNAGAAVTISQLLGEVTVKKEQELSVGSEQTSENLEQIDVRELKFLQQFENSTSVALAYRYFKQPVDLTLRKTAHEVQTVVETVVSKALVEVIAGHDPSATFRCRYRLKSSERQRLQIDLPQDMNSLGVQVNGKQAALEKNENAKPEEGWGSYYVNIARQGGSDQPFTLTLYFMAPLGDRPFENSGGKLLLRMPRIGGSDPASVAVQQLRTVVWVPDDYLLVESPENFIREISPRLQGRPFASLFSDRNTNDLENWISVPANGIFDFPTSGHHAYRYSSLGAPPSIQVQWWQHSFYVWILSGAVLLIGLVLTKTSWENKLGLLLLACFAASLYALRDTQLVVHGFYVAQWGVWAAIIFWMIHGIFGSRRPGPITDDTPPPEIKKKTYEDVHISPGENATVIPPPGLFDEPLYN